MTETFESMGLAARALGINESAINYYFSRNQKKPYKNKYVFLLGWDYSQENLNKLMLNKSNSKVIVIDVKKNITTSYESKKLAAKALGINITIIYNYIKRNQTIPYKNRYIFKLG